MTVALAVLGSLVVVFLFLNFTSSGKKIVRPIAHDFRTDEKQFTRTLGTLLGPALLDGNSVLALQNGDKIFPAMLEAIRGATATVTFETYIYWSGQVGEEFATALSERAKAGVRVHVLIDAVGAAKMDDSLLNEMKNAGVEVERFHPLRWYSLDRINNRTHRKLLVVDGRIGFTGGVGIADNWKGHAQDPEHWRDSHYRVVGPVVAQMQAAFIDHWIATTGTVLHQEQYFPALRSDGSQLAQVFKGGSDDSAESVRLMYLISIAAAERSIKIASAYFLPDDLTTEMLVAACRRGVKVQILMPGENIDAKLVRHGSRARWGPLLEAGAEMHEYQPTMFHYKVMIVDGCWTSVGSTNFDNRSFRLNDEANLNVHDEKFAADQSEVFDADLRVAKHITLEEWRNRPFHEKVREKVAALLRSQL